MGEFGVIVQAIAGSTLGWRNDRRGRANHGIRSRDEITSHEKTRVSCFLKRLLN